MTTVVDAAAASLWLDGGAPENDLDDGEELRGYDYPHLAPLRASDAECLCDADIAALLEQHNVTCIGFEELRKLQRETGSLRG